MSDTPKQPAVSQPIPAKASAFAAMRSTPFARVWCGGFVSNVGTWMQATALSYYTAHLTGSAAWTALVAAGEFAPTAILGPIGGALADRYSRKTIFMSVTAVQGIFAALLTWIMATSTPGAPVIALYALANGCAFAIGFPAFQSVMPELVPPESLSSAIGLSSASWNFGRVVGPSVTALLFAPLGIAWILGINAMSFAAVLLALITIQIPMRNVVPQPIFASILEGFRFVRNDPGLKIMIQSLAWNTLWLAPFIGLISAMVEKEFGGGQHAVGWLITAQGAGAVVTGVYFAKAVERFGVEKVMVLAMCACPVTLIAYGVAPNVWLAIPALFLTGLLYFAALSCFANIAQLRAPSEFRGRVLSINQVVLGSVYAIALGIQGPLGDIFGVRTVTVAAALISLAGLAVVRFRHPGATHAVTSRP